MDREKLILKYLDGEISRDELKLLKESGDLDFIQKLDSHLISFKAKGFNVDQSYKGISEGLASRKKKKSGIIKLTPVLYKIAAVLVLGLSIGFAVYQGLFQDNIKTIAYHEEQEILLPDASVVHLNKGSSISFNQEDFNNDRVINLKGEALFTVKKGSNFQVISGINKVTVLGTVFNVRNREGLFEVSCYEGSVKVENNTSEAVLAGNEKVVALRNEKLQVASLNNVTEPYWMVGKSVFESVPFRLVIKELELQYEVKVKIKDKNFDQNRLFTGSFSHDDINLALQSITIPFDLSFKLAGNQVILSSDRK